MYLERPSNSQPTILRSRLSPMKGSKFMLAAGSTPHWSPWRVVLLADQPGKLIESNLLLCLNEPAQGDFNFAEPGKTTFQWWNGTLAPGIGLSTHKEYIDFCAKFGIKYHTVIGDGRPWYVQSGKPGYDPPQPDSDVCTPRPETQLPEILAYAKEKGVGIRFWVHWLPLSKKLDEAFALYEKWGIRGLMVDFMDRDDQEMVEFQERVLRVAAQHKLHIQFHGSYKPSGEQRTFPNLFNREGVLNEEYSKWSKRCMPDHDVNVAYTRLLAGPVDYHLGGFRAATRETFVPRDVKPLVMGTRCHQLALYVVYENPMPMVADTPATYEGQPGFEFLAQMPTTWDETRFVVGDLGEYVVVARRQGNDWYLGGITNWTARNVNIPLVFLGNGTFQAATYADDALAESDPNTLRRERREVTSTTSLNVRFAPGGGFVAVFAPISQNSR
jgi:alpha-glucosidase